MPDAARPAAEGPGRTRPDAGRLTEPQSPRLTPLQGAVLGAVQGVAEVVPVSSSAQLALLPRLLGWPQPPDRTAFAAALHAGSCAGIAWALRDDLRDLRAAGLVRLVALSAPAAAAGLLAADAVERRLGTSRQLAALLAGAGGLLWVADRRPQQHDVRRSDAVTAAAAQALALVPGVSRSGAVLIALRARRTSRPAAHRHALLTGLPVSAGAAAFTLLRSDSAALRGSTPALVAGVPVAAIAAAAATRRATRAAPPVTSATLYRLALAVLVATRRQKESS